MTGPPAVRKGVALLAAAFVLLVLARLSLRSFDFYFSGDDYHNLRWALEYRDQPWLALTERHAMHDHIRPLTLLTVWATLAAGDAEPQLMRAALVAFQLAGFAALILLARRRGAGWWEGILAGLFVVALPGFQFIFSWLAWLCSAGEMAAGLWALVWADRALRDGRGVWGCIPLIVVAGLFKEPGWVVWPLGIAAMAYERRGVRALVDRSVLATLATGAAGFAFVWHSANLSRAMGPASTLGGRLDSYVSYVTTEPARLLDGWPGWAGTWSSNGPGVPVLVALPLLALVAFQRLDGRVAVVMGAAGLLGLVGPAPASLVCLGLLAFVAVRRWRDHLVELVVFGITFAALSTSDNHNEVQTLTCGYALALLLARGARVATSGSPWVATILVAGLGFTAARTATRALVPTDPEVARASIAERAAYEGLGALAQAVGTQRVFRAPSAPLNYTEVLEAFGVYYSVVEGQGGASASVNGGLMLPADAQALEETLYQRGAVPTAPRVQDGGSVHSGGLAVMDSGGLFAFGLYNGRARLGGEGPPFLAADACGTVWEVRPSTVASIPYTIVTGFLPDGCAPMRVAFTQAQRGSTVGAPFFVRLSDPRSGLWVARDIQRGLDVRPATVVQRFQPGGPPN